MIGEASIIAGSIFIPTVTKNSPTRASRKGRTSAAWWRKSLAPTTPDRGRQAGKMPRKRHGQCKQENCKEEEFRRSRTGNASKNEAKHRATKNCKRKQSPASDQQRTEELT